MPIPNNRWQIFQPFALLESQSPSVLRKVTAISGNLETSDMDLSVEDRQRLCREIQVIIHSAASINFNDPIQKACRINLQGVYNMMEQLAIKMENLEVRTSGLARSGSAKSVAVYLN